MENAMRKAMGCAAVLAVYAFGMPAPAAAAPFALNASVKTAAPSEVIKVETVRRKHPRRAYVAVPVRPAGQGPAPGCPGLTSWNPANPDRGFCDPGFAYHGNVNGCAEDLGYGRWVSCDNRR
jgi:hypothetical protein